MKVLDSIKRTMESIEKEKGAEVVAENEEFKDICAKYQDIPEETVISIAKDVKEKLAPAPKTEEEDGEGVDDELIIQENGNQTEVKDAAEVKPSDVEQTDANAEKAEKVNMNELDASEEEKTDEEELIVTEDEPAVDTPPEENVEVEVNEDDEEFDVYKDELDIVDGDKEEKDENAENIDMNIPSEENSDDAANKAANENADKIDMNIPKADDSVDAADKAHTNEANTGAKAAIANKANKGAFSSDVDALTDYLNEY